MYHNKGANKDHILVMYLKTPPSSLYLSLWPGAMVMWSHGHPQPLPFSKAGPGPTGPGCDHPRLSLKLRLRLRAPGCQGPEVQRTRHQGYLYGLVWSIGFRKPVLEGLGHILRPQQKQQQWQLLAIWSTLFSAKAEYAFQGMMMHSFLNALTAMFCGSNWAKGGPFNSLPFSQLRDEPSSNMFRSLSPLHAAR